MNIFPFACPEFNFFELIAKNQHLYYPPHPGRKTNNRVIDAPKHRPLTGVFAPSQLVKDKRYIHLFKNQLKHPEAVAFDPQGWVYTGTRDGNIHRFPHDCVTFDDKCTLEIIANTGGRPLGLVVDSESNLLIADGVRGLLKMDPSGGIKILATHADDGSVIKFADDVAVASDGSIYLSDACHYTPIETEKLGDFEALLPSLWCGLEGIPSGRILRYNPATNSAQTIVSGIYFANGVALSDDESFLVISETHKARLLKYQINGPDAGKVSVFADQLPGFPDNVRPGPEGTFWVAIVSPPNPILDITSKYPIVRWVLSKVAHLVPILDHYSLVIKLDSEGQPLASFHDPSGVCMPQPTHVSEHNGRLWTGTIGENHLTVCLDCLS